MVIESLYMAARAGAVYLPADPRTAVQVADAYVKLNGVTPNEIVFNGVAPNDHTLTIELKRELPAYVTLLVIGSPGREIKVIAHAQRLGEQPRAGVHQAFLKGSLLPAVRTTM
jgi:hypothetical protein